MKNYLFKNLMLGVMMLLCVGAYSQNTISGTITDGETGEKLIGANLLIAGTTIGTVTDFDGNYTLTSDRDFPWTVEISYTGFSNQELQITQSGRQDLSMSSGVNFNQEVVVSASRKQEKAIDAPASISVLSAEKLSVVADGGNVVNGLKNTVGVSIIDQGIDRSAIQLRGSAIVNQNRVQIYRDNRPMSLISTQNFESQLTPVSGIDIKQVEVLRGPAGALYGPGVDAGIVHFLTLDPWDKCGTTLSGTIGEQSLAKFDIRHANAINDKFGYKILLGGMSANDFQLEESVAAEVQANLWGGANSIEGVGVFEGQSLVHNGNLLEDVGNRYGTAALYFKPTQNISLTATYDYARFKGNRRNVQGDFYTQLTSHNVQLKGQIGDLFVAYNRLILPTTNDEPFEDNRAFNANYANGTIGVVGKEIEQKIEIQYPFSLGALDLTVGGDYLSAELQDDFRRGGRNVNLPYEIYGGYLQAKYDITPQLTLNAVARLDRFGAFDDTALSPRAALIYKPTNSSQIRVSYNRSFTAMNPVRTFLDFNLNPDIGNGIGLRATGGGTGVMFTNPTAFGLPFAQGINGASLAGDQIGLDAILSNGAITGALAAAGIDAAALAAAAGGQGTDLTYLTFRDNIPVASLETHGAPIAGLTTTNTFEIGYKGTIGDNLAVQVDIYNNRIENFESNATPITPFIAAPNLANDLANIANSAGLDGAAVAAAINGTPFGNGGNIGIAESDFSQTRPADQNPHINFGFLNFGEASYWGYDVGLEYYFNPTLSVFGNYSGVSTNEFSLEDLGEDPDSGFPPQFLNTPENRVRLGINYLQPSGLFGSIAYSYNQEYDAVVGVFRGTVETRNLVDLTVGYKLNNGLKATISVSNLFNNEYSYFPNLPQITRVATLNLQYHFGGKSCGDGAVNSLNAPSVSKADSDGDGVKDSKDLCPNIAGTRQFKGCPKSKADMDAEAAAAAEAARMAAEKEAKMKMEMEAKAAADEAARMVAEKEAAAAAKLAAEKAAADAAAKEKADAEAAAKAAAAAAAKRTAEMKTETSRVFNAALTGIQFNSSRATLKGSSNADLDKVVQVMNQFPEISVTIEGHTDSQGRDDANMTLSQERATTVLNYLVSKGISINRLRAVGYGETRPVADNSTSAGRAQNRRVAFVVN